MCGLAGILLQPIARPEADWQEIRRLFTATLIANEQRGRDAAGVAVIHRSGVYHLLKQPRPASELVQMRPYQEILAAVDADTTCLLGHARLPTKGSPQNNANNHPLLVGHTLGIHNGMITNDDELFAACSLPRQAEVDSEILFRLLDTVSPFAHDGRYLMQLRERLTPVEGVFAALSVDLRRPTGLVVLKQDCPLCVHYEPQLQALFFSSRYIFLRQAFGRSVITEALENQCAFYFDAERLAERGNQPVSSLELAPPRSGVCDPLAFGLSPAPPPLRRGL